MRFYQHKIFKLIFSIPFLLGCCYFNSFANDYVPVSLSITIQERWTPNSVIIPFTALDRLIMLKASVNGIEGNFILDTGANGLVLNSKYHTAEELSTNATAYGLSGALEQLGMSETDSLNLDELYFEKVLAQVIDLDHIEQLKKTRIMGLIGFDVVKDFEIHFQYRQRYLIFSKLNRKGELLDPLPQTIDKIDSIAFTIGHHIPVIEVKVDGKTKKMGIDTGAEYNLLNKKSCKDILKHFYIQKRSKVSGSGKGKVEVLAGKLTKVVLKDRYPCGSMSTILTNFNHLNRIYRTKLDGILGYQFLAPWRFSINYRKKKLFLHKLKFVKP